MTLNQQVKRNARDPSCDQRTLRNNKFDRLAMKVLALSKGTYNRPDASFTRTNTASDIKRNDASLQKDNGSGRPRSSKT